MTTKLQILCYTDLVLVILSLWRSIHLQSKTLQINTYKERRILSYWVSKTSENPHKLKENLPFLDTLLALSMTKFMTQRVFGMTRQVSMTNLGCRLNLIVCHALILSKLAMTKKWQVLAWNLWIFMWILEKI